NHPGPTRSTASESTSESTRRQSDRCDRDWRGPIESLSWGSTGASSRCWNVMGVRCPSLVRSHATPVGSLSRYVPDARQMIRAPIMLGRVVVTSGPLLSTIAPLSLDGGPRCAAIGSVAEAGWNTLRAVHVALLQ